MLKRLEKKYIYEGYRGVFEETLAKFFPCNHFSIRMNQILSPSRWMQCVLPKFRNKQDTSLSVKNQTTPPSYITFLKDKRNDSTTFQTGVLVIK